MLYLHTQITWGTHSVIVQKNIYIQAKSTDWQQLFN